MNQSCNFDVLLDFKPQNHTYTLYLMKKDKNLILLPISTITTFMTDRQTDRHRYGHGDSMTNPAQRAESVKITYT